MRTAARERLNMSKSTTCRIVLLGLVGGWGLHPGAADAQDGRAGVTKLAPALIRRLEAEPGPAKAWVYFVDKGHADPVAEAAAVGQVAATYNPRAVRRRALRGQHAARGGALFDARDLPVATCYVDALAASGARVHVQSRWLNAVSVWGTRAQLEAIAELPFVTRVEAVARARRNWPVQVSEMGRARSSGQQFPAGLDYGASGPQLSQIQVTGLHAAGYTGAGVVVGILDTGFRTTHDAFNSPAHPLQIVAAYDFVAGDPNVGSEPGDAPTQHHHGTLILGCIGAYLPGELVGGAYDASFILCKTEDVADEYPAEEDNYVAGLEFIEAHGGDMATASLGYIDWYTQADLDGQTAVTTVAVNAATSRGLHCCNAAGNEGHDFNAGTSHLIAPADAFDVITCGAATEAGEMAGFSSDGPTADGRAKPEVLARGVDTWSVSPSYDQTYTTASGTSLSTPLVACAVACLIQAHPEWTVAQLRDQLFRTADYYVANQHPDPYFVRGYGLINALAPLLDCNHNGVADLIDISSGTSVDCTGNGIPDECETDCNHNGIADSCDIDAGTSADCSGNGVPDECEPDCDLNGVPNSCEIAAGTAADCNGNGVPDGCDVAAGTSGDVNANGTPDECEADCNGNGRPDDADVTGGPSRDCNRNGVPDECELRGDWPIAWHWPGAGRDRVVAQDFSDVGYSDYSTKAWDDFATDTEVRLTTGTAYFAAETWAAFDRARFLVEIADRAGGAEAGGLVIFTTTGRGSAVGGLVTWDFGGAVLPAGTYWLSVQALGFSDYVQYFWIRANVSAPSGSEHFIHNPGDGFEHGADPRPGAEWYDLPADLGFVQNRLVSQDCNGNGVLDLCEEGLYPTVRTESSSTTVYAGDHAELFVTPDGAAPFTYTWFKDGLALAEANSSSLRFAPARVEDAGVYDALIVSPCGTVRSARQTLTVKPVRPPAVPTSPTPVDGAVDVSTETQLAWVGGGVEVSYKVMLGTDAAQPLPFKGTAWQAAWDDGLALQPGTRYHWQVLAKNSGGVTAGPVWSFTTAGATSSESTGEPAMRETPVTPTVAEPNSAPPDESANESPASAESSATQAICPAFGAAAAIVAASGLALTRRRAGVRESRIEHAFVR
jgi:subtilisin family serine protease